MAKKFPAKKVYTSHRGKVIDIDGLRQRNELTQAVGNARVNARGDRLGPGGKIIQSREAVLQEYYNKQGNTPDENTISQQTNKINEKQNETASEVLNNNDWIEDEEGNFVQKKTTRSKTK